MIRRRRPRSALPFSLLLVALSLPAVSSSLRGQENAVYDPALYEALEYRLVGPYRGGRVTAVTGVREKPYTFYMGSTGGGVWRTTDAGESWNNVSDEHFEAGSIGDIKVAPSDRSVIYVGTGSACPRGNVSTGIGVYRSTDGADSWSHVGLREAGQIGEMAIHPRDPDLIYVAALGHIFGKNPERGIFRSRDGGRSWEKVLFVSDSTGFVDVEMHPENPRILYAAAWRAERKPWTMISGAREGGIWRSKDGGDSWEKLEKGLPDGLVGKIDVTVSPADPSRLWALIEAPEPHGGVYRSEDGGDSWRRVNRNRKLRQRAWYYTHIYAHPKDPNTVYALNTRFYESVDGGKSFDRIGVPHGDNHDLWINPERPEIVINSNDGGANVTLDGGGSWSWSTQRNQPTAEFYSIEVDNQFPYRLYAPQQDNSTISVPSVRMPGITRFQHWFSVGGCETGPIAFDPDDPTVFYSGCYAGTIERTDRKTGRDRNVRIYPENMIGSAPKNLRYRFQWNAPIELSPHDPSVVYHASQFVHRTRDGGMTWETISPDLTTPEPHQIEAAGEPITHDETGVEVYPTVFALEESPHAAGTIWAATNDGHVWITRDDGESWTEITPDDMPREGTVNRIEISPHAAGRAFINAYRYRRDDFRPYIFRTENFGEDWELLTDGRNGIPADHPTRSVREDPDRRGLLYAGTEFGLFVSFDDGEHWQSLQLDLPHTPVTDLRVHRKDLVVATKGRSAWILDDLTVLHQLDREVARSDAHLFSPRNAYRTDIRGMPDATFRWGMPDATFRYYLAREPEEAMTLEVLTAEGRVVKSFTSDSSKAGKEGFEDRALPAEAGLNEFTWDLRYPEVDEVEDARLWAFTGGVRALPGTYRVRLRRGEWSQTREFGVELDPRWDDVTRADLEEQFELATAIRDTLDALFDAVRTIRRTRTQVGKAVERAEAAGEGEGLEERAEGITDRLDEIERALMQTENESGQDALNYPPMLASQIGNLYGYVAGPHGAPTATAYTRWEDLREEWNGLRGRLDGLLGGEVAALNETLRERGVPSVVPRGGDGRARSEGGGRGGG